MHLDACVRYRAGNRAVASPFLVDRCGIPDDHKVDMESSAVRIVVVDDVVDVADTLAMQLTLDGYDVATAYAANDAIQRIEAHQPHCVLPDISMPDITFTFRS